MEIYSPQEDSELLAEALIEVIKEERPKSFLDMGCGSCFQSKAAIKAGIKKENILAVDINKNAIKNAAKLGIKYIRSDLFENVKGKFDLIAFNAPYLPYDKNDESINTCGGTYGWEIIERFIRQAKNHLNKNGAILVVFSSLTNKDKVEAIIKENKFSYKELRKKNFFMEEIFVYELKQKN